MDCEKEGYNWNEGETLGELVQPERLEHIQKDSLTKMAELSCNSAQVLIFHLIVGVFLTGSPGKENLSSMEWMFCRDMVKKMCPKGI